MLFIELCADNFFGYTLLDVKQWSETKGIDEHRKQVIKLITCTPYRYLYCEPVNETYGPQQSPENNIPGIVAIMLLIYHIYYSV